MSLELAFQSFGAVAIAAGPGLRAVLIAAPPPIMGILNARQLEVLFPIGPLFEQGSRTVANLDPPRGLIAAKPRLPHIAQVFALGDRSLA